MSVPAPGADEPGMAPADDAAGACLRWHAPATATADAGSAAAAYCFDPGLPVLAGHFPGNPLVPGVHLLAAAARVLALARPSTPAAPALIERVRWTRPVRPGEEIAITARWRVQDGALVADCALAVDGQAAAQARFRYPA